MQSRLKGTRRPAAATARVDETKGGTTMAVSDGAVRQRTGRGWQEWFTLLDEWGARRRNHTEIARWLVERHKVEGWWAQGITVAYEQARGKREPGQRADGTFTASATKTIPVPVDRAFAAFADDAQRRTWLPGDPLHVRRSTRPRSLRADWLADASQVVVTCTAMGDQKCRVAVEHRQLPDAVSADRMKDYWRDALTQLRDNLRDTRGDTLGDT